MKDYYYFDNAATTWPKPEIVYQTMDSIFRQFGVNPGRAGHEMAVEAERIIVETRYLLAQFFNFNGDPNRVIFTQNATDSLNMALFGLLDRNQHVISTRLEHNSVLRPLNYLQRDREVRVTAVNHDSKGYIDPDDVRRAISVDTRVVVVNHASNVLGTVQDVEAIGKICQESGLLFVLDTCQSAGVLPIDMEAMGIDVLTFTGHKGLFGPMGIGGMVVAENLNIPPMRVGGTGVDSIMEFQPDMYPNRLEAGTVNFPGIVGLNAGQKWFADLGRESLDTTNTDVSHNFLCRAAMEHIESVELGTTKKMIDAFVAMDGVELYGPIGDQPRISTFAINIGDLPADQVGVSLDADFHVCVRAGLHCAPLAHIDSDTIARNGSVRFSPGYFNDEDDVNHAIEAVGQLADI